VKDILAIFDDSLKEILKALGQKNYAGCSSMSTDLITVSVLSGYSDGTFMGEVFEGVFDQLAPVFDTYEVSDGERNSLEEGLREQINIIAKSYKTADKRTLYSALRDMRALATEFQLKCFRTLKSKREIELRHGGFQLKRGGRA
jgi:hypothetical protein